MFRAILTLAALVCLCFSVQAADSPSPDATKLAGTWRYEGESRVATYTLAADGTFSAELREGVNTAKFKGRWKLDEGAIEYTYHEGNAMSVGDRDKLLRVDETSFTIEAGDGQQRTYWRVKL